MATDPARDQSKATPADIDPATANLGMSWGPIPEMTGGMTFTELGNSGLRAFAGYVREEFLPQLTGRQAARVYREMMDNDPVIGGIMYSIVATMRKVEWRTVPATETSEDQEGIDFLDECRDDMSHTWNDLIVDTLSMLGYGYAPHEIVYKRRLGQDPGLDPANPTMRLPSSKYDDGKIAWRRIPVRGQDTVLKWFFDENGIPVGLTQQPWVGPLRDIPMEKMLLFRPTIHKNNPEGRSILRNAYRPYWFIKRLQEQEAILFERLNGIPIVRVPDVLLQKAQQGDAKATAAINSFKKIATNIRIDEQMGMVFPSTCYEGTNGAMSDKYQYDIQLVTPGTGGGRSSVNAGETIKRYELNMMVSVLADFLQLGHEARGTQSLAISKTDMFFQAIEGFLNGQAEVFNRYGIPRLWEMNGKEKNEAPRVVPDLALRTDLDVMSNYFLRLSQAGMMMFPNEELEKYLLEAAGAPDVEDMALTEELKAEQEATDLARMEQEIALQPEPTAPEGNRPVRKDTNLERILKQALARRMNHHAGARFGYTTKRRHVHRPRPQLDMFREAAE